MAFSLITPRDTDILAALERCPLTASQLQKLSGTFEAPFNSDRAVRRRVQILADMGLVRTHQCAVIRRGMLNYYTLAPAGFLALYGSDEPLPHNRLFSAVSLSRLPHTQALAEVIVHTAVAAHRSGIQVSGFCRENSVCLSVGSDSLYPDSAFQLITPDGRAFSILLELDNVTERVRSQRSLDSWERKLRLYEAYQNHCPKRFRVVVVTTGTMQRVQHILALAGQLAQNPERSLVYGITLDHFLETQASLTTRCFLDHRLKTVALVGPASKQVESPMQRPIAATAPSMREELALPM